MVERRVPGELSVVCAGWWSRRRDGGLLRGGECNAPFLCAAIRRNLAGLGLHCSCRCRYTSEPLYENGLGMAVHTTAGRSHVCWGAAGLGEVVAGDERCVGELRQALHEGSTPACKPMAETPSRGRLMLAPRPARPLIGCRRTRLPHGQCAG